MALVRDIVGIAQVVVVGEPGFGPGFHLHSPHDLEPVAFVAALSRVVGDGVVGIP